MQNQEELERLVCDGFLPVFLHDKSLPGDYDKCFGCGKILHIDNMYAIQTISEMMPHDPSKPIEKRIYGVPICQDCNENLPISKYELGKRIIDFYNEHYAEEFENL